jgi:hypothetical protein
MTAPQRDWVGKYRVRARERTAATAADRARAEAIPFRTISPENLDTVQETLLSLAGNNELLALLVRNTIWQAKQVVHGPSERSEERPCSST